MKATIPFRIIQIEPASYHPLIEGEIDGVKLDLILDTGASRTVIEKSIIENQPRANTTQEEVFAAGINAQKMEVEQVEVSTIKLGNLEFENMLVFSTDLSAISTLYEQMAGIKIGGLLGCDFLEKHKAVVDFGSNQIVLKKLPFKQD
jgi:predicted aspartyl protease